MKKILLFGEPMALLATTTTTSLEDAQLFQKKFIRSRSQCGD